MRERFKPACRKTGQIGCQYGQTGYDCERCELGGECETYLAHVPQLTFRITLSKSHQALLHQELDQKISEVSVTREITINGNETAETKPKLWKLGDCCNLCPFSRKQA